MRYQVKQCSGTFRNMTPVKRKILDQPNANTQWYFFQLYSGLDLDINKQFFNSIPQCFSYGTINIYLNKKNSFPIKKFNKLLKIKILVSHRRSTINKRSSRESLECQECNEITTILQLALSPPQLASKDCQLAAKSVLKKSAWNGVAPILLLSQKLDKYLSKLTSNVLY